MFRRSGTSTKSPSDSPKNNNQGETENTPLISSNSKSGDFTTTFKKYLAPEHISSVYENRFKTTRGKTSKYTSAFDSEHLVTEGEKEVFNNAVNKSMDLIRKKHEKWNKLAEEKYQKTLEKYEEAKTRYKEDRNADALEKALSDAKLLFFDLKPLTITALDFGCGDGRDLELWIELADKLKELGITVRVKAYDIVESGIESYKSKLTNPPLPPKYTAELTKIYGPETYEKKLKEENFPSFNDYEILRAVFGDEVDAVRKKGPKFLELKSQDNLITHENFSNESVTLEEIKLENTQPTIKGCGIFKNQNLEIEFLLGKPDITPSQLKENIGEVDLSLILYGTTSHIFPTQLRNEFFKAILSTTNGYLATTIPGQRSFENELAATRSGIFKEFGMSEGEIFYSDKNTNSILPYATYDHQQTLNLPNNIGAKDSEISVAAFCSPVNISNSRATAFLDYVARKILPSSSITPKYFGLVATDKDQNLNKSEEAKTAETKNKSWSDYLPSFNKSRNSSEHNR